MWVLVGSLLSALRTGRRLRGGEPVKSEYVFPPSGSLWGRHRMAYPLEMDSAHFTPPLSQLKHMLPPPLLSGHEGLRPCCSCHPQPSSLFLPLPCIHLSKWCPSPQIPQLQSALCFLLGSSTTCTCQELTPLRSLSGRPCALTMVTVSFWLAALYSKMTSRSPHFEMGSGTPGGT